jgi:predicted MFS family arabinose efflux permease
MSSVSTVRVLPRQRAIIVFLAFAFAYFLSSLIRAITATLSPVLTQEFALNSADLGLLAGGYFLGFAAAQLPLGRWLDKYGPKKVMLYLLLVAVLSCVAFSLATSFSGLLAARVLSGVGVSACLMAPLTGYRRWYPPSQLLRANSWMLMTGALGVVSSTLPVQWLLPLLGWRALFLGLATLVLISMALIAWQAPRWHLALMPGGAAGPAAGSYSEVWKHPYFRKMAPLAFVNYGGLIAMQTLWAAPWMIKVAGYTPLQAASGLFWINVAMLLAFWAWGAMSPWLARRGFGADRLIAYGLPSSFVFLAILIIMGGALSTGSWVLWALYCVSCTFVSLAQPAVGMAFSPTLAGRALSAYNLLIFVGVFAIQWGIGLALDGFKLMGLTQIQALQSAMGIFLLCSIISYGFFLAARSHNEAL